MLHLHNLSEWKHEVLDYSEGIVLVDFGATWCGPCNRIKPYIQEISEKETMKMHNIKVVSIDIDELQDLAIKWEVTSVPTFMIFFSGKRLSHWKGIDKKKINSEVNKYFVIAYGDEVEEEENNDT